MTDLSGPVAVNTAFCEAIEKDIATDVGLSYLITKVILWLMVRSILSTLVILLIVGSSVLIAFIGISIDKTRTGYQAAILAPAKDKVG